MSQLLDGRYQFIKILGSDALGRTYLVGDTQLSGYPKCVIRHFKLPEHNPRTLKFVLTLLKKKAESLQKFSKHDRIPEILAFFEENNNFYLVEEFILGRPLSEEMLPGQPFSETRVVQLLKEILEILVVVHGWGVVHRSIKPSNLIRRRADGVLTLAGFGIFREIGAQAARSPLYSPMSTLNGTSAYTPLDQRQGQLHFNTDLYAVGIIGIQALLGLSAENLAKLMNPGHAGKRDMLWHSQVQVSVPLRAVLDRLIHPDSKQRYRQASEVLDDLNKIVKGEETMPDDTSNHFSVPTPTRTMPTSLPDASRRPWRTPAIATVIVLGMVIGALALKLPQSLLANYFLSRGTQQRHHNEVEQAIANYTRAIQLYPSSLAYYRRGMAYSQQQEPQAALEDLTRSIQLTPNSPGAYYERGNLWFTLGDRQKALSDYTQAIRLDPNSPDAYVNRGTVRADLGDEAGAIEDYSHAIQLNPNLTAAYLNRCLSRSNMGDHQTAIADCTQAINLQPNSVLAYQNRGLARRRLGDRTGAIEDFNIAIRLDPMDPDPYYNRGLTRYEMGDKQGAIADYTAAIQHDPDHVFAYYDRGLARVELEDIQGAIADLQQSAKLCLDSGRTGCYQDAQFQLEQLQNPSSDVGGGQRGER